MRKVCVFLGLVLAGPCLGQTPSTDTASTNAPAAPKPDMTVAVNDLLTKASAEAASGDLESAARDASVAIQIDPKDAAAFETRGSIYIQQKLWDRADRDYQMADKLAPDPAYKYKLGEIKYLQRSFEDARSRFAKLADDPRLGDLARYKMFLCDELGFHEAAAARDLAEFDQGPKSPAASYSHIAWDLFHAKRVEAQALIAEARQQFDAGTNDRYFSILLDTRRYNPDTVSFATRDGHTFDQCRVSLERAGLRVGTDKGWVTVPIEQLPDDLSVFPEEMREEITRRRAGLETTAQNDGTVSFTTKGGKSFTNVRWSLDDKGVGVLGANGWTTIPYAQLPDDVSAFPAPLQQAIADGRHAPPASTDEDVSDQAIVTFTTRSGTAYDHVRASLGLGGLHVLTTSGWKTIPAAQLPADLSPFPADWRAVLALPPVGASDSSVTQVVTFKTRRGELYTEVQAALEAKGLRLLTWKGWIAVPFDQLPDDLSPFPEGWRKEIAEGRVKGAVVR